MKNKLAISFLALTLILSGLGLVAGTAEAQVATFPAGCTSTVGYSTTNGAACNGTSTATTSFMSGCTSTIGYSTTTGAACNGGTTATTSYFAGCSSTLGSSTVTGLPCSGGTTALPYLAGCTSTLDYSTVNGAPCNGTSVATTSSGTSIPPVTITTPGLPTTGAGGDAAANLALLAGSGLLALCGIVYFVRRSKVA